MILSRVHASRGMGIIIYQHDAQNQKNLCIPKGSFKVEQKARNSEVQTKQEFESAKRW